MYYQRCLAGSPVYLFLQIAKHLCSISGGLCHSLSNATAQIASLRLSLASASSVSNKQTLSSKEYQPKWNSNIPHRTQSSSLCSLGRTHRYSAYHAMYQELIQARLFPNHFRYPPYWLLYPAHSHSCQVGKVATNYPLRQNSRDLATL